jgi:hypothetical protein
VTATLPPGEPLPFFVFVPARKLTPDSSTNSRVNTLFLHGVSTPDVIFVVHRSRHELRPFVCWLAWASLSTMKMLQCWFVMKRPSPSPSPSIRPPLQIVDGGGPRRARPARSASSHLNLTPAQFAKLPLALRLGLWLIFLT